MSHSPAPSAWWLAPLEAAGVAVLPWLNPWEAPDAYPGLVAAFADPCLYHLACGMGTAPSEVTLREAMSDPPDVHLWRLPPTAPGSGSGPGPLLVHSIYTTAHRIGIWHGPGVAVSEDVWGAVMVAAIHAVFRHEPEASHVFVHLPLPTEVWQEAFLLRAGFDPFEVDAAYSPIRRELYGLSREVFAELQGNL